MATYTRTLTVSLLTSGLAGTLGYTVLGSDGSTLIARATAGVTEEGASANYYANVAAWDTGWGGRVKWDAGAGVLALEDFQADLAAAVADEVIAGLTAIGVTSAELSTMPVDRFAWGGRAGETPLLSVTLRDETGTVLPLVNIASLTLKLTDEATRSVIRAEQSVLNVNNGTVHATSGLFSWAVPASDTTLVTATTAEEIHVARFTLTTIGGKVKFFYVELSVREA